MTPAPISCFRLCPCLLPDLFWALDDVPSTNTNSSITPAPIPHASPGSSLAVPLCAELGLELAPRSAERIQYRALRALVRLWLQLPRLRLRLRCSCRWLPHSADARAFRKKRP
jgi:hypothetical protein